MLDIIILDSKVSELQTNEEKLIEFAGENGYDISISEMQDFFTKLVEGKEELSDAELDQVAGGKSKEYYQGVYDGALIITSGITLGIGCVAYSVIDAIKTDGTCYILNPNMDK